MPYVDILKKENMRKRKGTVAWKESRRQWDPLGKPAAMGKPQAMGRRRPPMDGWKEANELLYDQM